MTPSTPACTCQDQHRRGYCTEPGCPYSTPAPTDAGALADEIEKYGLRKFVARRKDVAYLAGKRIVAALRNCAPQETRGDEPVRTPKVRTSHHRNKEEAARLQALVDERYAASQQSPRLEREGEIVWLREIDAATDSACWVVCNRVDPGAVMFTADAVALARTCSSIPSTSRAACHDHPTMRCTPDDCCQRVSSNHPREISK